LKAKKALLCVNYLAGFRHNPQILKIAVIFLGLTAAGLCLEAHASTNPPATPVHLIFIHHSCGENWLSDGNGGLGVALRDNNYFVSDTNYGWGPEGIGDSTDIGQFWLWFRGPDSATIMSALYAESESHCEYSRLSASAGGENQIIMFKSCFPNSALQGSPGDPVPPIESNPLRGEGSGSEYHTVANSKGIYIDLLEYFKTRPDKLFVVVTAPPLADNTYADNARAFNDWLVNDWLSGYTVGNVFVFDFYNVLTSNGGNPDINDLGMEAGNHHRWWNGAVQHKTDGDDDASPNTLEYATGDDHPSSAGNQKATGEFLPLLNNAYNNFMSSTKATPTASPTPSMSPTDNPSPTPDQSLEPTSTTLGLSPETLLAATVVVGVIVTIACVFFVTRRNKRGNPFNSIADNSITELHLIKNWRFYA
jgi:hypothetical protein